MKTDNYFYIRILSPVHLGCDEVYEPMGFVVNEYSCKLTAFEPLDFFRSLNPQDRERYAAVCRKGTVVSLIELYGFMKGKSFQGHEVAMSKGLVEHYRQTLSMKPNEGNSRKVQQELNNFTIARTAFNPHDNLPYIPGSAIKGALRTAYLNHRSTGKSVHDDPRDRNAAQSLEKQLLQYEKLEKDPFRLLKVSDFMPVQATTKIFYAVNEKKIPSKFKARGPYQILEVIEPGAIFTGTITIEERYAKEAEIKQPLTAEVLFKSADAFYANELKRERDELTDAGLPILNTVDPDGGWPLRIGRHSGAESVTIEGHRNIKIMQGRDKPPTFSKTGATTFWLAAESQTKYSREQLQPFGWAALGKLTESMSAGNFGLSWALDGQHAMSTAETSFQSPRMQEADMQMPAQTINDPTPLVVKSPLEKILDELSILKPTDAGRMEPIVRKMELLESDADKTVAGTAFKDKLGKDSFKKSKFRNRIEALIRKEMYPPS